MSAEIDPWALPGTSAPSPAHAGIPTAPHAPFYPTLQPLDRRLPWTLLVLGVLYVLVSLAGVLCSAHEISLLNQVAGGDAAADRFQHLLDADHLIATVAWVALVVFIAALVAIRAWQSSLSTRLGSVGARRAVFRRAGYIYFRGAWLASIILSLLIQLTSHGAVITSFQDAVGHDQLFMLYYALRAAVGLVLIFFAYRLKKISEEAVARLTAAPAARARSASSR